MKSCKKLILLLSILTSMLISQQASAFPINDGSEANAVIGQLDFNTGYDPASILFGAQQTSDNRFFANNDIAYDAANERLFVSDTHNHRILVFDLSNGVNGDLSASFVLGQSDFTTGGTTPGNEFGNTNSQFGECDTEINACGIGTVDSLAYDAENQRLFASDQFNHRVLAWDLSNGITNGMAASFVLGQADLVSGKANQGCGGVPNNFRASSCGLSQPTGLDYDALGNRLFVTDSNNNRVLVFDTSNLSDGMEASGVLGQPDFLTREVGHSCSPGVFDTVDACSLNYPQSVAYDGSNGRLFVSDSNSFRVTVYPIGAGSFPMGDAATSVLGQPDLDSQMSNTSCGGGTFGDDNTNGCGMGIWGTALDYNDVDNHLYVSDQANHRTMIFDVETLDDGQAAIGILGQTDNSMGYDPTDPSFGGGTSRSNLLSPSGIEYDASNDRLFVSDSGNHRIMVFSHNIEGTPVDLPNGNGTVTTDPLTGDSTVESTVNGTVFEVDFPAGTDTADGEEAILVNTFEWPGLGFPSVNIQATLPAGETKTITIPHQNAPRAICIWDHDGEVYTINMETNFSCTGDGEQHTFPSPPNGTCVTHNVHGNLGDNPNDPNDPGGFHDVEMCTDADGESITISGLRHTTVVMMDTYPEPPDSNVVGGGCNTSSPFSILGIFFLCFFYIRKSFDRDTIA